MFQVNQVIQILNDVKHNLFLVIADKPKIGDRVITEEGIVTDLLVKEDVELAISGKAQVIIPFIPSIKQ